MTKVIEGYELAQMQGLPLEAKIVKTQLRIREWYDYWDGLVYVSFSGGKDSTVLLHLVRDMYPDVPAVFADTGLEYPEIKQIVKETENVTVIRPEMSFKKVLETHGYPVVSKRQAQYLRQLRTTKSEVLKRLRLTGIRRNGEYSSMSIISKKWQYLKDAPFKISERCCDVMKKRPFTKYSRETKRVPIIGTMASESVNRKMEYLRTGCNSFKANNPKSMPISFWTEQDVLKYLVDNKLPLASVYGEIVIDDKGVYSVTGVENTGCIFCMFGVSYDPIPNRFQQMYHTHPRLWEYCINDLGLGEVLDFMDVPYEPEERDGEGDSD